MGGSVSLEKVIDQPIQLPENPFWQVFKRFGRDELIALVVNAGGTAAIDFFVDSAFVEALAGPAANRLKDILVATTGPVIEKSGFFPAHINQALKGYRAAPKDKRDALSTYLKKAFREGGKSLMEDILVHDPIYIGLMYAGLKAFPETPAAILSVTSFLIAVGVVTAGEVGVTELLYKNYKNYLKKRGFGVESFYESRFLISKEKKPDRVLEALVRKFSLDDPSKMRYADLYFENNLPFYNGRSPKLRLRRRENGKGGYVQTGQIVYTLASELSKRHPEQFRYFPQKKEKIYFHLNQEMPDSFGGIEDIVARRILVRALANGSQGMKIGFTRDVSHDDSLLVSVDSLSRSNRRPFYVLELKVYQDIPLLKEVMRYVMSEFPVIQTTQGKKDLLFSA